MDRRAILWFVNLGWGEDRLLTQKIHLASYWVCMLLMLITSFTDKLCSKLLHGTLWTSLPRKRACSHNC